MSFLKIFPIVIILHGHCVSILWRRARCHLSARHACRRSIDRLGWAIWLGRELHGPARSWRPLRTRRALPPSRDAPGEICWNLRILQIFTSALSARQSRRSWLKITPQLYTFLSADAFLITPAAIMQRANPLRRRLYSWRRDKRALPAAQRVSRRSLQVKNDCDVDRGNESMADRIAAKCRARARPGRRACHLLTSRARAPASSWRLPGAP